jgi:aspartyl-tRNA(Asn)/glutamyl-tRNA(Gln) amidotransferase subunit C
LLICNALVINHQGVFCYHFSCRKTMQLSRPEVEKVSLLARLKLSESELETMTNQLGRILVYVEQLQLLNTESVLPMAHAVEVTNVFRADSTTPSLPREAALANAPKADGTCYQVPAVLGE